MDESVHCVVTSPPYWGLRDYKIKPRVWGGREDCEHEWQSEAVEREMRRGVNLAQSVVSTRGGAKKIAEVGWQRFDRSSCSRCSAWLGVLGLEPTPEMYVEHIVEVFREVRRVLRSDGTVWLNLGDSYAGSWGNYHPTGKGGQRPKATERFQREAWGDKSFIPPMAKIVRKGASRADGKVTDESPRNRNGNPCPPGLKPKDLCLIPARVALALQADGWWVRSEIIWSKPNPMPESVTDRPTTAHEKIFLLTKSARYFYDQEAVRENVSGTAHARQAKDGSPPSLAFKMQPPGNGNRNNPSFQSYMKDLPAEGGRNLRSVWTMATQAFADAHFATFAEELVERCIKAGTSEKGCCARCGAPWVRILEKAPYDSTGAYGSNAAGTGSRMFVDRDPAHDRPKTRKKPNGWQEGPGSHDRVPEGNYGGKWIQTDPQSSSLRFVGNGRRETARNNGGGHDNPFPPTKTLGWQPSCKCGTEERRPAIVLDPFSGSGTTVLVADKLGRIGIGLDLKGGYCQMAYKRCQSDAPLLVIRETSTNTSEQHGISEGQ